MFTIAHEICICRMGVHVSSCVTAQSRWSGGEVSVAVTQGQSLIAVDCRVDCLTLKLWCAV